ncbi:MAG: hypothetical protein ACE5K4_09760 [Candidatus Hydrothermarchaeota archaeon]
MDERGDIETISVLLLAIILIAGSIAYKAYRIDLEHKTVVASLSPLEADHYLGCIQDTLGVNLYSQTLRIAQEVGEEGGNPEDIKIKVNKKLNGIIKEFKGYLEKNGFDVEKGNISIEIKRIEPYDVGVYSYDYVGGIYAYSNIYASLKTKRAKSSDNLFVRRFVPARFYTLYELSPTYKDRKRNSPVNHVVSVLKEKQPEGKDKAKKEINKSLLNWAKIETSDTLVKHHVEVRLIQRSIEVEKAEVEGEGHFIVTSKSVEYVPPQYVCKAKVRYELFLIDREFKAIPDPKLDIPYTNLRYRILDQNASNGIKKIWEREISVKTDAKNAALSPKEISELSNKLEIWRAMFSGGDSFSKTFTVSEAREIVKEIPNSFGRRESSSWSVSYYGGNTYTFKRDGRIKAYVSDLGSVAVVGPVGGKSRKENWGASTYSRGVITSGMRDKYRRSYGGSGGVS